MISKTGFSIQSRNLYKSYPYNPQYNPQSFKKQSSHFQYTNSAQIHTKSTKFTLKKQTAYELKTEVNQIDNRKNSKIFIPYEQALQKYNKRSQKLIKYNTVNRQQISNGKQGRSISEKKNKRRKSLDKSSIKSKGNICDKSTIYENQNNQKMVQVSSTINKIKFKKAPSKISNSLLEIQDIILNTHQIY